MTTTYKGASRSDGFTADPEFFTIVTDKSHPLYDERIEIPLDDPDMVALIASIREFGVGKQIIVVKDGDAMLVKDGNQRVRASREANKLRIADGLEPVQVRFRVAHEKGKNAAPQAEKATLNIHVRSPAMTQARLAAKLEEIGKSREQIATAMGCTPTMVDNYLRLLDCAPAVQEAVETKKASPEAARTLASMPQAEQEKALETMLAEGVAKGSAGVRAAQAAKRGEKIEKKNAGRRMKNRIWLQEMFDRLDAKEGALKKDAQAVLAFARMVLGYRGAEKDQCDDVAEVLDEMADAKKPAAKAKKQRVAA